MTRPSPLSRPGARLQTGVLGPAIGSGSITFDGHEGTTVEEALTDRPPSHVLASTDPTTGDDETDGHVVGCRWVNLAGAEEFVAVDVSTGAAVWTSTTAGGGGGTVDIEDEGAAEGAADTIDFVGAGVSVSFAGGVATVDIPGAVGGSGDLVMIDDTLLGSDQANITFTGIPSTYRDLVIVVTARTDRAGNATDDFLLRVGSGSIDTGSNYLHMINYTGSSNGHFNSGGGGATAWYAGIAAGNTATAGYFSGHRLEIIDYASTTQTRAMLMQSIMYDTSKVYKTDGGGVWENTSAAIDQVRVYPGLGTNLKAGTRATLYGRGS